MNESLNESMKPAFPIGQRPPIGPRWRQEWRLLWRQPAHRWLLAVMLVVSALSVCNGLARIASQEQQRSAALLREQRSDELRRQLAQGKDTGLIAYYLHRIVSTPAAPLTFLALGQREVTPVALPIRALSLTPQRYGSERDNAELKLAGGFDFAFVLIYLSPLLAIALVHDWRSGEREAGRLVWLESLGTQSLWRRRLWLRFGALAGALLAPPLLAVLFSGAFSMPALLLLMVAALYLGFWFVLGTLIGRSARPARVHAGLGLAAWLGLVLLVPAAGNLYLEQRYPTRQGIELTLANRQAVNGAWDEPRAQAMARFFTEHPEWQNTPPVQGRFHWKWYYAMQHAGDMAVAAQQRDYEAQLRGRDRGTEALAWLSPAVAAQVLLHGLAGSDQAQVLAFQQQLVAYHGQLRRFFYPFVFKEQALTETDMTRLPLPTPLVPAARLVWPALAALLFALALTGGLLGWRGVRRKRT